jgi:hypothetical protein
MQRFFDLVRENGKPRAALSAAKEGPSLSLYDEKAKGGVTLTTFKDGPALILADESGKLRAGLHADKNGAALNLFDGNGNGRATLGKCATVTTDGKTITYPESSIRLFGADGKGIWAAP